MKTHRLGPPAGPAWTLQIHEAAKDELVALDDSDYARIEGHLERLAEDPCGHGREST